MRNEWRQGRTAILNQVLLSTIAALLLHLGLGCSTGGHRGPKALTLPLAPTDSNHLIILFSNVYMLPLFFHLFTQVHLLIDSSIEGQYISSCLSQKYYSKSKSIGRVEFKLNYFERALQQFGPYATRNDPYPYLKWQMYIHISTRDIDILTP